MREQPWMRHVTHQMTKLILEHKDVCKSRLVWDLSQDKRIECAVRAVIKLYCADVSCERVSCLHPPVDFLEFRPGHRNHHHLSEDVEYHGLQLVCHYEVGRWLKMEMLPAGVTVALSASESCETQPNCGTIFTIATLSLPFWE